jgi:purine nucleoside phosphorylase
MLAMAPRHRELLRTFRRGAEMNTRGACAPQRINLAAGLSKQKVSHEEVLEVGKKATTDFARLLNQALA